MISRRHVRLSRSASTRAVVAYGLLGIILVGCLRGSLPPREFYRLVIADSVVAVARPASAPPLLGSMSIAPYDTPGIYGSGALVYRVGALSYGAYPAREWAIPLGQMLAAATQEIAQQRGLTSGRVSFDSRASTTEPYEWRGTVREFDEVDAPASVSVSVALAARIVRVADDSVIWSGTVRETQPVAEARSIDAVVAALSAAASRAIARLTDQAGGDLRRLAAAGARER